MTDTSSTVDLDAAFETTWDALVIGAGPAGALAARELARAGARTLLVERAKFPRWKVCGACLNGHSLAALETAGLGSLVDRIGGVSLDALHIGLRGRTSRFALPAGKAVTRARLDAALVAEAVSAGAQFLGETRARVGAANSESRSVDLTFQCRTRSVAARVVIAASGLGEVWSDRKAPMPRNDVHRGSRVGAGCVVPDGPDFYGTGAIHMAVGREGYVGLVRVEDGTLNVAAAFDTASLRSRGSPASAAAAVLDAAGFPTPDGLRSATWQGTPGLTRHATPLGGDRLFLIGDAAGYVEPFTGEGIAWALSSAQAITPLALRAGACWAPRLVSDWAALHARLVGRRQWVCRGLATILRHPWLARATLGLAASAPGLAGPVLDRLNAPPLTVPLGIGGTTA